MRLFAIIVLGALLAIPFPAWAPNCKKGQPCGNSCISWSKTCRIGTPAATSPATAAGFRSGLAAPEASTMPAAKGSLSQGWAGSIADAVYFDARCPAARDLHPDNTVHFNSEAGAKAAGYRRSSTPGC